MSIATRLRTGAIVFSILSGWIALGVTWAISRGIFAAHEPWLLLVCGQETAPGSLTYHDCSSRPVAADSQGECIRAAALAGWLLTTGPVQRAMSGTVIVTCEAQSNIRDRHTEPLAPDVT